MYAILSFPHPHPICSSSFVNDELVMQFFIQMSGDLNHINHGRSIPTGNLLKSVHAKSKEIESDVVICLGGGGVCEKVEIPLHE